MFIDELKITAKAGDGGDGVVRWRHEKFRPMAGPSGGNGGNGGNVYVEAISDLNKLSRYTGNNHFEAKAGEPGRDKSQFGKNAEDLYIKVPVGTKVTNLSSSESFELNEIGETKLILKSGRGGLGNEVFKSSTNQAPQESTKGKLGEAGEFLLEVSLIAEVGLIGLPSAGKSTLLNNLTNSNSAVGAYHFTTLEPHLGKFYEFTLADLPGLIEGASSGKGLGHRFLRHISRTKMLLHLVALGEEESVSERYETVKKELTDYAETLNQKEEWIILTKSDLINKGETDEVVKDIDINKKRVFVISENDQNSIKNLSDALVAHLRGG